MFQSSQTMLKLFNFLLEKLDLSKRLLNIFNSHLFYFLYFLFEYCEVVFDRL